MKNYEERFAYNIKRLRCARGLTQTQLAEALSYSDKSVSKWERGSGIPAIDTLYRIAVYFAVGIDELFRDEEIYLLGVDIDINGTRTDLVIADQTGNIIRKTRTLGASPAMIGLERAREILNFVIREFVGDINFSSIIAYIGCATGVRNNYGDFFEEFGFKACRVSKSIEHKIPEALGEDDGIVMTIGSGINICAQKDGKHECIGSWGYFFDEGGSAFNIARDALSHYFRVVDGVENESLCSKYISENVSDPKAFSKRLSDGGKLTIASYAPAVFRAANDGDAVANSIIEQNIEKALRFAENMLKTFGEYPVKLVVGGGLFDNNGIMDRMKERFERDGKFKVERLKRTGVSGTLALAKRLAEEIYAL